MSQVEETRSTPKKSVGSRVVFWLAIALVTVMYVYALVAAFGNIIGVFEISQAIELGFSALGVLWIAISAVLPIIIFVLALLLGKRRSGLVRVLVLFLGLAVVSIWQLNLNHFVHISNILA